MTRANAASGTGKVWFVGAGPGDPDLITVKGLRILQEADVVVYTDSLVSDALIAHARPDAEVVRSAGMTLEEIVAVLVDRARVGKTVARVHTGDPSVFGAVLEQIAALEREGIPYAIVPGVSAVFAAAAAARVELTVPGLCQTVILTRVEGRTPMPEGERLRDLARHGSTLALFLSAALTKKVTAELRAAGWGDDTPVVVVHKASWPDEKVVRTTLGKLDEAVRRAGIRSHAMILAGRALDPTLARSGAYRSCLYDPAFTHGCRTGRGEKG